MLSRASAGDLAGAVRLYKTLADLLAEDYGLEPSAATKSVLAEIKAGAIAPKSAQPEGASSQRLFSGAARLAISIPPVRMHEINPEKIHLVVGFRQHLIASLIRFREWQITDTPYGGRSVGESHRITNRYELQMDVHQNGSALHLLFMLKNVGDNLYVWSDGFELKLENWLQAQRQVVHEIALTLNVHLSAERLRRLSETPDISLGIYDRPDLAPG